MVKITDIAAAAGVSPSTVSNVLNGRKNVGAKTRDQIIKLCEEMGYTPNEAGKTLKIGHNKTVLFNFSDFDRKFYLKIIQGISDYVYSEGYDLLICTNRNCDKYMNKSMTCGCIMLDVNSNDSVITRKASPEYPIVVMDRELSIPGVMSILVNNYAPQAELMETLIERGYKKFAFVGGFDSLDNRERFAAFKDVLDKHGLPFRREDYYAGDYREKSGYQAARLLMLTENLPDAVICANDDMAFGVMRAFKENGIKVPEDVSVTGFDDSEMARTAGLTTIQIPNYERGYIAAQYLIDCIEGNGNSDTFKISAKVKWRRTTK